MVSVEGKEIDKEIISKLLEIEMQGKGKEINCSRFYQTFKKR